MLTITNVSKTFHKGTVNEKVALRDINITFETGDYVTVIGGNGAGKRTQLNLLAGTNPAAGGSLLHAGEELTRLPAEHTLEFDGGIPEGAQQALGAFFARESIVITKHSKKGDKEVDIKPLLHSLEMPARNQNELRLVCVLSAQNPGLNPQLRVSASETYLPEWKPVFARICRMEVLDDGNSPFR